MKINNSYKGSYAVSEVVGGLFLIVMAILSFSVIRLYAFPDLAEPNEKIDLQGYLTDDGYVLIEHIGGKNISNYRVIINDLSGKYVDSIEHKNLDPPWSIGSSISPLEDMNYSPLLNETDEVEISVYNLKDDGGGQLIFTGVFTGLPKAIKSSSPILISSLKTNSPDEDLICYSYPIIPKINAKSYIYNWKVNGLSLEELNFPFDTENNAICKDYSGNGLNGTLVGAVWTTESVVGGGCYLGGPGKYITLNLPPVFNDISNNDFSISIWIKNSDITNTNATILMASKNANNFIKIFLKDNEVHFGICYNGIKDSVRTNELSNNIWYNIVAVWNAKNKKISIYCNGVEYSYSGYRNFAVSSGINLLELGNGTTSDEYWNGYMDELVVYKRALSKEQIYQMYLSTKDGFYDRRVIVSEEIKIGESWQCIVTPNDNNKDDNFLESNIIQIVNYPGGG